LPRRGFFDFDFGTDRPVCGLVCEVCSLSVRSVQLFDGGFCQLKTPAQVVSIKDCLHRFHCVPGDRRDLRDSAIRQRKASHGCPPQVRTIGEKPDVRDDGTHTNVNETIDQSVFERWRAVPTYRPPNLADWAARKKVDLAKLSNSVRADDPAVAAPD